MRKPKISNPTREEWDALPYVPDVRPAERTEDGWIAVYPELGEGVAMAYGETRAEAVANLEELRKEIYDDLVASGVPIPYPTPRNPLARASGKFLVRTSPRVHRMLAEGARRQGQSLNAYVEECLLLGMATESLTGR
ncbi:hypothetical protein BH11ARM2_BH11ARM2_29510 [soil metagenome]